MLLVLVLLLSCISSLLGNLVPSVAYISFVSVNAPSPVFDSADVLRSEVIISNSDDSPLVEIELPYVFPYFGHFVDRVFVSPNGYIQTHAAALTSPTFTSPCQLIFDGVIAGYLADFTTHTPYHKSNVSILQTDAMTSVRYKMLSLYGHENISDPTFDFNVNLMSDGAVNIEYDNVSPLKDLNVGFPDKCDWVTGLIARNASIDSGAALISTEQASIQNNIWETTGKGIYPSVYSSVGNGNVFVACPISTVWCATPAIFDSTTVSMNLTTLSLACIENPHALNSSIDIAVQFEISSSSSFVIDIGHVAPCTRIVSDNSSVPSSSPVSLECKLSGISFSSYLSIGSVHIHVLWKPSYDEHLSSSYHSISDVVPPIQIRYESSTSSSDACSLNQVAGSCTECDICNSLTMPSNLTCLNLTCPTSTVYHTNATFSYFSASEEMKSLYSSPSCSQTCETTFTEQLDKSNVCCDVGEIDCLGTCFGTALEGVTAVDGYTICCAADKPPDCLGVCGGTAVIDTCNVCMGNDTGILCPTGFVVDTGSNIFNSSNHLMTTYDALNHSYVSIMPVTVFNTFNTSVFIEIIDRNQGNKNLGPSFQLPSGIQEIEGYQNFTLYVSSNFSGLFSEELSGWEVKTLFLRYKRPSNFDAWLTHNIDVLPKGYNCDQLTSISFCMEFPGCMHCLWQDGELRTLRETEYEVEERDNVRLAYNYYYDHSRILYPKILPDFAGIDDYETDEGFCIDGFGNAACPVETSHASRCYFNGALLAIALVFCNIIYTSVLD